MTTWDTSDPTADKARGLLFGVAVGDALGADFEGTRNVHDDRLTERERSSAPLEYTDDTALTLVLARHLAERDRSAPLDEDALAAEMAQEWQREPWRGYGMGSHEIFQRILTGTPWLEAATGGFGGRGSFGNGGAMRVAPVALVAASAGEAADLARRSALVTHAHPDGQYGTVVQACAVFLALHSDPRTPLDRTGFLDELARNAHVAGAADAEWRERLDQVRGLLDDASPTLAADRLGSDAAAPTSVPLAVLAFLKHPDEPVEAIRYAIRAGGARTGVRALPQAWLHRLERAELVGELADALAHRVTPPR